MYKKFLVALSGAAALSCHLFASEAVKTADAADWRIFGGKDRVIENVTVDGEKVIKFAGVSGNFVTKKLIPVDPSKKYRLSGEIKLPAGAAKTRFYIGFMLFDAKQRLIASSMVNAVPGSDTVLAAPVKKGDKIIRIADGSKWQSGSYYAVAFLSKPDYSDLPNFTAGNSVLKVEKKDKFFEVTLEKPSPYNLDANTGLRQHRYTGTYLYLIANRAAGNTWQKFSGTICGVAKYGAVKDKWWAKTANAAILMICNIGAKEGTTLVRNITFEEVK